LHTTQCLLGDGQIEQVQNHRLIQAKHGAAADERDQRITLHQVKK
jgi:hypothetical protein